MTETPKLDPQVEAMQDQNTEDTQKRFQDPYEFLATFPNAPTRTTVEDWKSRTPNRRLRVFTPDGGKRAYIVRAVGALELQKLQETLPANLTDIKREVELQSAIVCLCCAWTNAGTAPNNKLADIDLKTGAAGLPVTLFQLVSFLSDYADPETIGFLSAEL